MGAQRSQRLGVPGEDLEGVIPATTFLKDFNLRPETRLEGTAAVVGSSTAMDAARSALRAGAGAVRILYRRTRAEMPAQHEEVRAALAEGIHLHELVAPKRLVRADGRLRGVRCPRMVLGAPDAKGRRQPVPDSTPDAEFELAAEPARSALGQLRELAASGPVTLVFAARDPQLANAVILRDLLQGAAEA